MKITIVQGPYYPVPALLQTGVEKMWHGLGAEFARRGHRVVHLSRQYPGLPFAEIALGVDHRRIPSRNAPRSPLAYRAYDLIYSLRARRALPAGADILVTNCMWLPILIRNERWGKLYVHVARFPKGQMGLYRHAARIQAVSAAVAEQIVREIPGAAGRIRFIPSFLSNARAGDPAPDFSARAREIVYLGRVHPEKGVHLLVAAFARAGLADTRLTIAGSHEFRHGGGGPAYLSELRSAAGAAVDRIHFTGLIEQERLNPLFDRAALLVCPSLAERGEAFPIVPLEAMARGCPALVSDLACFLEYLRPEENGFVFARRTGDTVASLAGALARALGDESRRRRIAAAGYATSQAYRLEPVAQRYLDDFGSLTHPSAA